MKERRFPAVQPARLRWLGTISYGRSIGGAVTVQGCKRGGLFSRSTCTAWSPVVDDVFFRDS